MTPATPTVAHYDGQDLEALADLERYTTWILEHFSPHLRGRVLEVGAGIGNVSARYLDQVDEALLVEPAVNLHHRLAQRFADRAQVTTSCSLLEDLDPALTRQPFDAAILVNVLEHIPNDEATLRRLHSLLRPGGAVLLFVPALPWLFGSLDTLVHHVRRYTRPELEAKLLAAGFAVELLRYFDVLGIAPWFIAGKVLRQRHFDPRGARLYDRFGVPATRWLEQRVVPPIGKSLVAIGVRREPP